MEKAAKRQKKVTLGKKVTKRSVEAFYKQLKAFSSFNLPPGNFKCYDSVDVKTTAHSGV